MSLGNLNALKMFDAAARHLNFRLAAEELNLTQGAVAQQVRGLEALLGTPLFHRLPRGLELTDGGREYQRQIRRALVIIDSATVKLLKKSSRITLSVTPSFASKWLVPRLPNFASAFPEIDLHTFASGKISDFKTDAVDIAIRLGGEPFARELEVARFASTNNCAVCSPEFAENLTKIASPLDFVNHQLIQDAHFHWDNLLESFSGTETTQILQFNQTSLAIDAAMNGQGIVLSPLILVAADIDSGKLVKLWQCENDSEGDSYYLLSLRSAPKNFARERVIQWLLNEAGDYSA